MKTRSGRRFGDEISVNTIPARARAAKPAKAAKPASAFTIFDDSADAPQVASNAISPKKKKRPAPTSGPTASNNASFFEMKKMKISDAEKDMNGAPEGDLFDVKVLDDADLHTFSLCSEGDVMSILECAKITSRESAASWGNRFQFIEALRAVIKFNARLVSEEILSYGIRLSCECITSLRSSESRNAVFAIRSLLSHFSASMTNEQTIVCLERLVHRSGSGPKFVTELSANVLMEVAKPLPLEICIRALGPHSSNKNAEIAAVAISALGDKVSSLETLGEIPSESMALLIQSLSTGLSTKRSNARQKARSAVVHLAMKLLAETFHEVAESSLSESRYTEVRQALKEKAVEPKVIEQKCSHLSTKGAPPAGRVQTAAPVKPWMKKAPVSAPKLPTGNENICTSTKSLTKPVSLRDMIKASRKNNNDRIDDTEGVGNVSIVMVSSKAPPVATSQHERFQL